jgi:hypothetical protein
MRHLFSLVTLSVCLTTTGAADWNRFKEDFRHSHKLNSNGRVSVEGFNGSIRWR